VDRCERAVPYSVPTGLLSEYLWHGATLSGVWGVVPAGVAPQHGDPVTLWTWSKMVRRIVLAANLGGSPLIPRRTLLDRSGPDWLGTTCDRHVRSGSAAASRRCSFGGPTNYVGRRGIHRLVIDEDEQTGARHILKPVAATVDPTPRSLKGYLMAYSMLRALERRRSQPCGCGRWHYGLPWSRAGRRLATTCRARGEPCVPGSFANYVTFSCYPQSVFSGDEGLTTAQLRWQRSDWQSSLPSQRG
jgi:hypothetical protein